MYIYGISYGGIYAPNLAYAIHHYNQELEMNPTKSEQRLNLRGFIIGNGATDYNHDPFRASVELAWQHNLISRQHYIDYRGN